MEWDEDDDYDPGPEEEEYPRDSAIDDAKENLLKFFSEKQNRQAIFYLTQLKVILEKPLPRITARPIFHWITAKAIGELVKSGMLRDEYRDLSEGGTRVRFIFHPSVRYTTRVIDKKLGLIQQFSEADVGKACGNHAEILFSRSLLKAGFRLHGRNTNQFQDKRWLETGRDLDFIVEKDGIYYGCEIKNRFEYITRDEFRDKINLSKFLGLRPLFVLRSAPKNYIYEIRNAGGFTKIFDWHIYPYGMEKLTASIRSEFPGLPAYCVSDLPDPVFTKFLNWHESRTKST